MAGVECHLADLGDLDAIQPAFEGVDAVVHLAAASGDDNTPDDILRSNVTGTYHVFEAARLAGVSRVIFASSGATVAGWERDAPWSHLVAGRYDEAKTWPRSRTNRRCGRTACTRRARCGARRWPATTPTRTACR